MVVTDWRRANPVNAYSAWPLQTGQDFLPNHVVDGIDFASIHMWPDNWGRTDQAFGRAWLDAHLKDAWYLGKPVVIEEFGKAIGARSESSWRNIMSASDTGWTLRTAPFFIGRHVLGMDACT